MSPSSHGSSCLWSATTVDRRLRAVGWSSDAENFGSRHAGHFGICGAAAAAPPPKKDATDGCVGRAPRSDLTNEQYLYDGIWGVRCGEFGVGRLEAPHRRKRSFWRPSASIFSSSAISARFAF